MRWSDCCYLVRSDAYRVAGDASYVGVLRAAIASPSSRLLVVFRVGAWARAGVGPGRSLVRALTSAAYRWMGDRHGIELPFATVVGPGLKISHRVGGVIVHPDAVIGSGVTLTPGTVIGNNAGKPGAPRIGDFVVLSVGTKVIGDVTIGRGVQVGANSVVCKDLPADVVAAGAPARVLASSQPHLARFTDFEAVLGSAPVLS